MRVGREPASGTQLTKLAYAEQLTAALALLGISLLASGNTHLALRDFDKRIRPWHRAMLQRDELAKAAQPGSHLVVPEAPAIPSIFFTNDICDDPDDWRNVLYSQFYRLASVRVESPLDRAQREAAAARAIAR